MQKLMQSRLQLLEYAAGHSLDDLLLRVLTEVGEFVSSQVCYYCFVEQNNHLIQIQKLVNNSDTSLKHGTASKTYEKLEKTWDEVLKTKKPVVTNNSCNMLRYNNGNNTISMVIHREIVVPVIRNKTVVAILGVGNKQHEYTEKDIEIVSYMADVTWQLIEHKMTDMALKESERMYRNLSEEMPVFICTFRTDFTLTYVNKSYADYLTSVPELLTGTYFFDFVHDHEKSELSGIYYSLTVEHPSQTYSHEAIVGDKTVWHQWTGRALFNDSGTLLGYQAIGLDITEQKEAQKEKELLQGQLIQAQKMESVGRLAGGIAHDFNNMLSVIMGEAEILMMGLDPTHPHYDNLKDIRKAALRSADLTRQLLAFARKQVIAPQVLNLNDTIEGMLKILRRLIGEDIELTLQPGNELWLVKVDPGQIDQILANLCVNARDAISIDGQIEIETGNVTISKKDCKNHPGLKPDEYVFLSVHDNGCGMNEDTLNKIFEPFFTTKSIGKGTGLGLATVYGIVKQNNGFIHAQSAYGNGSTFIIYFPRFSGEEQPSIVQPNQQNSASGSEKILLVEDDPDHLKTCTRILESLGYTVKSSENPNEALIVAEINKDIDLIITDIVMPQMNGSELASKVDTIIPGIKKLFMSGYPTDVIVDQGILSKQINYIHKPFSIKDLADIIRDVIEGKPKN